MLDGGKAAILTHRFLNCVDWIVQGAYLGEGPAVGEVRLRLLLHALQRERDEELLEVRLLGSERCVETTGKVRGSNLSTLSTPLPPGSVGQSPAIQGQSGALLPV